MFEIHQFAVYYLQNFTHQTTLIGLTSFTEYNSLKINPIQQIYISTRLRKNLFDQ
jgi:hypothetical protein